ncbi:MAG: hypothetical protein WAW80_00100 [Candidatus Saccharimonadales bacterium]
MIPENAITTGLIVIGIILLLIFLVRVWILVRRLSASFGKLGFLVREDAKKYFDDASNKIVDTNGQFQQAYQKIVEDGTRVALAEKGMITEKILVDAHNRANEIILSARTDAQQIIQASQKDADEHSEKMLQQTGSAIAWVLSQYLHETYTTEQHEKLIEKQVRMYIDEQRK